MAVQRIQTNFKAKPNYLKNNIKRNSQMALNRLEKENYGIKIPFIVNEQIKSLKHFLLKLKK